MANLNDKQLLELLNKYRSGTCTEEDLVLLDEWFNQQHTDEQQWVLPDFIKDSVTDEMFVDFSNRLRHNAASGDKKAAIRPLWKKMTAVAAAIILIAAGITVYRYMQQPVIGPARMIADIPPGQTGAVLTLADGSTVVLDSAGSGAIAQQGNVQVINANGQLTYKGSESSTVAYNTLSTPKARRYQVVLPDGTKVWLNASSSISYPVAFTGNERKVKITGEAYFEVVHNAAKPFNVQVGNTLITDIGTVFDVNAYNDEPIIKTTLLEGAVSVNKNILKPGEQAQVDKSEKVKVIKLPDAQDAIAWKSGEISFDNVDVATLMRQLSRWYDVDVVFTNGVPEGHLIGTVSIKTNLSTVIKVLNFYGIHCSIEGKKLIVAP